MFQGRVRTRARAATVAVALAAFGSASAATPDARTEPRMAADKGVTDDGAPPLPDADPKRIVEVGNPLGEIVMGSADAPITVVEYSSMTCSYSADFRVNTFPLLKKKYVESGKARWILREYASDPVAVGAFQVALCASPQHPAPYIDGLFRRQSDFLRNPEPKRRLLKENPREALYSISTTFGFDRARYDACLTDDRTAKGLANVLKSARQEFKVEETPAFFINGKALTGNPGEEEFEALFDGMLKGQKK
jgi:protein-disulfide isomerase